MKTSIFGVRWPALFAIAAAGALIAWLGWSRLSIDTDIVRSLPSDDPVIRDAAYVMRHLPVRDRIAIDLGANRPDVDLLLDAASVVEERLAMSGLFAKFDTDSFGSAMPMLIEHIINNLPILFSEEDLKTNVAPLTTPSEIRRILAEQYKKITDIGGIGQAGMIARDPLELRNIVMARLAYLAPTANVQIVRGRLLSADGRHLLITAEPRGSSTDTAFARRIEAALSGAQHDLVKRFGRGEVTITPVGAYRAALDNEEMAKNDTKIAVAAATIGIAILLLIGFPRPFIGVLALFPALMGTACAMFVYSLLQRNISVLAVGFGSTIISFTVDYGIAYLLFLDRPNVTRGFETSREVWGIGLLAMLTTATGFAFLFITGFSALGQIGAFAAIGVVFTYLFVHTILPLVFPEMPPAGREGSLVIRRIVDTMMEDRPWWKAAAVIAGGIVMLAFARPDFHVDLSSMNSVSRETLDAEKLVTSVWGDVMRRVYVMTEADSLETLRAQGDRLDGIVKQEALSGAVSSAFIPTSFFPGRERVRKNIEAWRAFWVPKRVQEVRRAFLDASREVGFAPNAFRQFFSSLERRDVDPPPVPPDLYDLLGIVRTEEGRWAQFSVLIPASSYHPHRIRSALTRSDLGRIFDPALFADQLGAVLLNGFITMAIIIGCVTLVVSFIYLLEWRLALIALAPTIFALVCTSATMNLLSLRLGIPAVIVMVIVIGMGTDYALYLVRAYQRYRIDEHPSLHLIRMTVFLSAMSTMIGFGVLAFGRHILLRNVGIALLLGIGYSFIGAVAIVPPLVRRVLCRVSDEEAPQEPIVPGSHLHHSRVRRRYRMMEPYPRVFAACKLRFDPMFAELHRFIGSPGTIIDIGTGFGVPAAWILEIHPSARVYGIEPDWHRCLVASQALGSRGIVMQGRAPELPSAPGRADTILAIDMIHYLNDEDLLLLLMRMRKIIARQGVVVIRATVPREGQPPLLRLIEHVWTRFHRIEPHYRNKDRIISIMNRTGFSVAVHPSSRPEREEQWFIGKPSRRIARRPRTAGGGPIHR